MDHGKNRLRFKNGFNTAVGEEECTKTKSTAVTKKTAEKKEHETRNVYLWWCTKKNGIEPMLISRELYSCVIPKPVYPDDRINIHPKQFTKCLKIYMEIKNIKGTDQLFFVESTLRKHAVRWFLTIKHDWINFVRFEVLFLRKFFPRSLQMRVYRKFKEGTEGRVVIRSCLWYYFCYWLAELKYLDYPRLTELEAVRDILKHFPTNIMLDITNTCQKLDCVSVLKRLCEIEVEMKLKNSVSLNRTTD